MFSGIFSGSVHPVMLELNRESELQARHGALVSLSNLLLNIFINKKLDYQLFKVLLRIFHMDLALYSMSSHSLVITVTF